ncbi:MAG: phosphatase PAP2 family protein [Chlorobi bacterium]|nr:phosphatase PAP2 family protein [Chlorobiota bacterium]
MTHLINRILIFVVLAFFATGSFAEAGDSTYSFFGTLGDEFKACGNDAVFVGKEFMSIDRYDLSRFVGIAAVTALLMPFDEDIRSFFTRNKRPLPNSYLHVIDQFGNVIAGDVMAGSVFMYGMFADNPKFRTTGRLMFESMALSGAVTMFFRITLGRSRPRLEKGAYDFEFFELSEMNNSFPSGHSAVSFALASVLAERADNIWASVGLYTLASSASIIRLYYDQHWATDLAVGAVIGTISGKVIYKAYEATESKPVATNYIIYPTADGLGFCYRF